MKKHKAHQRKQQAKQRRAERLKQREHEYYVWLENHNNKRQNYQLNQVEIKSDSDLVHDIFGSSYFCMKDHG